MMGNARAAGMGGDAMIKVGYLTISCWKSDNTYLVVIFVH
jgi:hypothetical protein